MHLGSGIREKPIPDPGSRGKKAPDPGSGSATLDIRSISKFWSISMLLDPDQHSQYGSGSRTAKRMRISADSDPQHGIRVVSTYLLKH